ncbi:MAG: GerMN domain-containing protein [Coriobacteriia bacterium]|nr:GerMN domain-containing protein [Coriobacteriia bacterium]
MHRTPTWRTFLLAVVVALLLATPVLTGCRGEDDTSTDVEKNSEDTSGASDPDAGSSKQPIEVEVYFVRGEGLGVSVRSIPSTTQVAHAALRELLARPDAQESGFGLTSEIPDGTTLNSVSIADGRATVDLSSSFDDGGGSLSMQMRAAQIVYTLTQFPTVTTVDFELDGEPIEALGGEGIDVVGVSREDFTNVLPMILVERPAPGQTVTSPVRLSGLANTFEATFVAKVTDSDGNVLTEEVVTYDGSMGSWAVFDVSLEFETEDLGLGTVVVYEQSAKDGKPINVVEIPVRMKP